MNPKRKINEKAVKAKESDINIRLNGTCSDMTPIYVPLFMLVELVKNVQV